MNKTPDNPAMSEQEMTSIKARALFMDERLYNKSLQLKFSLSPKVVAEWGRGQK